jgi:hypothetical protein
MSQIGIFRTVFYIQVNTNAFDKLVSQNLHYELNKCINHRREEYRDLYINANSSNKDFIFNALGDYLSCDIKEEIFNNEMDVICFIEEPKKIKEKDVK